MAFAGEGLLVGFGVGDGLIDEFDGVFDFEVGGFDEWDEFSLGEPAEFFDGFWAGGDTGESREEVDGGFGVVIFVFKIFEEGGFVFFKVGVVGVPGVDFEVFGEIFEAVFNIANGVEPTDGVGENFGRLFVD